MKKKICAVINMFVAISLLTSCATKSLWEEPEYSEEIRQFFMTQGGDDIVIIGQKYHYIFPADQKLKTILNWKYRNDLRPKFGKFAVRNDGITISGDYSLAILPNKFPSEEKWLKNHGFELDKYNQMEWVYTGHLEGKRYIATTQIPLTQEFAKPYKVTISEEFSILQKAPRIAATPITKTVDGVVVIGAVGTVATVAVLWCVTNKCSSR